MSVWGRMILVKWDEGSASVWFVGFLDLKIKKSRTKPNQASSIWFWIEPNKIEYVSLVWFGFFRLRWFLQTAYTVMCCCDAMINKLFLSIQYWLTLIVNYHLKYVVWICLISGWMTLYFEYVWTLVCLMDISIKLCLMNVLQVGGIFEF